MAPIMSFTAEQISDHYQKNKQQSIHLQDFSSLPSFGKFLASKDKQWEPELGDDLASLSQIASQIDTMKFIAEHRACQQLLQDIRSALLKAIEAQREKGLIKHPLEVRLTLHIDLPSPRKLVWEHFLKDLKASGQDLVSFLKEFMIISQVNIVDHKKDLEPTMVEGLYVRIDHAEGDKCPRCWNWEKSFNEYKLCRRCQEVLGQVV
jgi:isoleucyl-tRNA synthetase